MLRYIPKRLKRVIQLRLVHILVQIPDKQVGADVDFFGIIARPARADRFTVQFDLVEDFDGVVGVLFGEEFAKAKALVGA